MKLIDTKKSTRFRLLQISESGHGKTHRTVTATQFGKLLIFDTDNKLTDARDKYIAYGDKIELASISTKDGDRLVNSYDEILNYVINLNKAYSEGEKPYATVAFDTWSTLHDLTIEKHRSMNPNLKQFTQQDWGAILRLNSELFNRILALPCNLIINAHIGKSKNVYDQTILTVGTTGSFGEGMLKYFNETHALRYELGKYKARGKPSDTLVSKTMLDDKLMDSSGNFLVNDLSIFDSTAYNYEQT